MRARAYARMISYLLFQFKVLPTSLTPNRSRGGALFSLILDLHFGSLWVREQERERELKMNQRMRWVIGIRALQSFILGQVETHTLLTYSDFVNLTENEKPVWWYFFHSFSRLNHFGAQSFMCLLNVAWVCPFSLDWFGLRWDVFFFFFLFH